VRTVDRNAIAGCIPGSYPETTGLRSYRRPCFELSDPGETQPHYCI